MANSVDPDQTAPSGAVWSGSALFAYTILSVTLVYFWLKFKDIYRTTNARGATVLAHLSVGMF